MKKLIAILMVLLFTVGLVACGGEDTQSDSWPTSGLGVKLPKPDKGIFDVYEYSTSVTIEVKNTKIEDFTRYVEKCKDAGFTIDQKNENNEYSAYNNVGEKLRVNYYFDSYHVYLDESKVNGTISWPTIGPATLIPEPDSTKGTIDSDTSSEFSAWIGETTPDMYSAYVEKCIEAGFDEDFEKDEYTYSAKKADGISIEVEYVGFNTLKVTVEISEEETTAETTISETDLPETNVPDTNEDIRPEFKEAMDAYEAFFREYCDIIKRYNENPTDPELIKLYSEYMVNYAETMTKLDELDDGTLSDAELEYYAEVSARITAMLLEVE